MCLLYLSRRHSPDFEVVGSHEEVRNTGAHGANDPLVEGGGLGVGDTGLQGSINHAVNAFYLLLFGKHGDVVLERVGYPSVLAADVRDALVGVPVIRLGKGLVDAVVEVLVVREDNVAADIVQLRAQITSSQRIGTFAFAARKGETYESFRSDVGGCQTAWLLIGIDNHPRGAILPAVSQELHSHSAQFTRGRDARRTIWSNRLAAPSPVGPAPMIRTSTLLRKLVS